VSNEVGRDSEKRLGIVEPLGELDRQRLHFRVWVFCED